MSVSPRERGAAGRVAGPAPLFTADDDYVTRASYFHFSAGAGTLVQTPDGDLWTVVYHNLDGWGVIEGDHPEWIGAADFGELPPPTHMLREPYKRHHSDIPVDFLGDLVRVVRRVKDDGAIDDRSAEIAALSRAVEVEHG